MATQRIQGSQVGKASNFYYSFSSIDALADHLSNHARQLRESAKHRRVKTDRIQSVGKAAAYDEIADLLRSSVVEWETP